MADVFHLPPTVSAPRPTRRLVREPEIAELRAFCAAVTLGSIAEAARSLGVSGPALSKRLRTLEAVVGAELLQRSTRGVTLTAAGLHLYGPARRLLGSADSVQALMQGPATVAPVKLACTPTIAEARLPRALGELAALEPGLAVELMTANSSVVRELVREGRVELGIAAVSLDDPSQHDLGEKVIWRDEVVVAVPPGHPWTEHDEIPVEAFVTTPLVQLDPWSSATRSVIAGLARLGLEHAPPLAEIGSNRIVLETATRMGAPALVSRLAAQASDLAIRRVRDVRFDREFALVWNGSPEAQSTPVQAVFQYLVDLPFARSRRAQRAAEHLGVERRGR